MSVYFISDTHFGHKNIHEKFRQCFSSVEEHDNVITDNILSECGKRDTLWILGDVVIHRDSIGFLKKICDSVEYVRVILGNHDGEYGRKNNPTAAELLEAGVTSCHGAFAYKDAWLTHIPIHPREFYRKPINIHGHIHDDAVTTASSTAIDRRYFNASCEAVGYRPIEFTKIKEWVNGQ